MIYFIPQDVHNCSQFCFMSIVHCAALTILIMEDDESGLVQSNIFCFQRKSDTSAGQINQFRKDGQTYQFPVGSIMISFKGTIYKHWTHIEAQDFTWQLESMRTTY